MLQPELRAATLGRRPVQVIAVTGGKGGTGKTSVAVNLATALAQAGRRAMLLDGDLGLANCRRAARAHAALHARARAQGRAHARGGDPADPLGRARGAGGLGRRAHGGAERRRAGAASCRPSARLPEPLDVLIVDTAAGIGESVLQFCQSAQQVLVVLRDEPTSLTDTYALIKVLSRERGVRQFRVLANMTRQPGQGEIVFRRLQRVTDRYLEVVLDFVGEIPEDAALQKCRAGAAPGDRSCFRRSPAAQAFSRLARTASGWPLPAGPSGRLEFFFERLLARPAPQLKVLK